MLSESIPTNIINTNKNPDIEKRNILITLGNLILVKYRFRRNIKAKQITK
jgi:hypothetical protein